MAEKRKVKVGPLKSIAEHRAETAAMLGADAFACPSCGCRDLRVVNTHVRTGGRVRQRICRSCGTPVRTVEVFAPEGSHVQVCDDDT